jgi:hypothetical protein
MLTGAARPIGSLSLLVATIALVVFGPQWPGRATSLMCGESIETISEKALLPDMETCFAAMSQSCYCQVKENPFAAEYYLALVPITFVAAVWGLSAATARGMAAVVLILATTLLIPGPVVSRMYSAGMRIPVLLQALAIGWPQFVFFGPTMFWPPPDSGLVLPQQWAPLLTLAFWLVAACGFGLLARRLRSPVVLLATAGVFVTGTALAARLIAPLFNWHMTIEGP